eukprot:CAMPEP_0113933618 /NCGR_PEP_ID=MMETSP1339-20121228/801_1 /TAXON_ID=94617 /ORGANISM="Fibrocapsa japonica" /LENGTH=90 /DNA_ID=CAMNT_0000934973 /DNA_START=84 /DNA_END=356 /DNA_ORIENTATION=- /assembly_acc=CAM_ASM_000762
MALSSALASSLKNKLKSAPAQSSSILKRTFASSGKGFSDVWLGDKGSWPVIAIITGACVFCAGWTIRKGVVATDVRFLKSKRMNIWTDEN